MIVIGCFAPSDVGVPKAVRDGIGVAVEWVIRQDYCFNRGGCDEFQIGGAGVDFFDENYAKSGTSRCRYLAHYLVARHPTLSLANIIDDCEIRKIAIGDGDDDQDPFAIPDIITDAPGIRTEFYEVKPNSSSGRSAGRKKMTTFLSMVDFLKHTDPAVGKLRRGEEFNPDRYITIFVKTMYGFIPCEVRLHYKQLENEPGIIVYEFCLSTDQKLLKAMMIAIVLAALMAAMWVLRGLKLPEGGIAPVPVAASVLADSVGPDGTNFEQDVRYVQALLNDWLDSNGETTITLNGIVTEEMVDALSRFQTNAGLEDTGGNVWVVGETVTALQDAHLNALAFTGDLTGLELLETGFFDADVSDPIPQETLDAAAQTYLQLVRDNVGPIEFG